MEHTFLQETLLQQDYIYYMLTIKWQAANISKILQDKILLHQNLSSCSIHSNLEEMSM